MTAGVNMPVIEGITVGMTRENCMAYCYNKKSFYKYFGESVCEIGRAVELSGVLTGWLVVRFVDRYVGRSISCPSVTLLIHDSGGPSVVSFSNRLL